MSPFYRILSLFLLLSLCCAMPALADFTLGGSARAVAMGGAGLASGDAGETAANPAFLAESGLRLGVQWPNIATRMQGAAGLSDAISLLGNPKINVTDAFDLVKELGSRPTEIDASANAGLLLPHSDLQVSATVRTFIKPDVNFADWVKDGSSGAPPAVGVADVSALGETTLPSVGIGMYLPKLDALPGKLAVGVRVKPTKAYYSHYVYNVDAGGNLNSTLAPEMGGKTYLSASSISADMGLMFTPTVLPNFHVALMVDNLIEPKAITFNAPDIDGLLSQDVSPRTFSLGAAWVNNRLTLAADLVDLTGAISKAHGAVGGELRMPLGIALRGGYNSHYGFTAGFGFRGFGLAYSQRAPLMLSNAVAF